MSRILLSLCVAGLFSAAPAFAQATAPPSDPLSGYLRNAFNSIKTNIARSAEKMPEADYAFKPAGVAAEVRSFGQIVGHVANAHYLLCARVRGEANPNKEDFEKKAAKADLVKAIADSIAYCDGAYAALTDATVTSLITVPGPNNTTRQVPVAAPAMSNIAHDNEHYGNIVTYLRAKGIVPPSSEPRS